MYRLAEQVRKVSGIKKNFEVGSPNITNNPFDIMIQGDGFFGIILPNDRINYTRDGSFNVDRCRLTFFFVHFSSSSS